MDVKLIVVGGKASKGAISLKLPTVVGRSRDADLTVSHPMVSRRHCEIFDEEGLLSIRDLGSLNGTIVDGRRVSQAALCPDAEFTIGPLTFRAQYRYDGPLDAVPPPKLDMRPVRPSGNPAQRTPESQAPESQTLDETPKFSPLPPSGEPVSGDRADAQMPSTADFEKVAAEDAVDDDDALDFDEFDEVDDLDTDEEDAEPEPSPTAALRKEPAPAPATKPAPPRNQSPWSSGEQASEAAQPAPDTAENEADESDEDLDAFLQGLQED